MRIVFFLQLAIWLIVGVIAGAVYSKVGWVLTTLTVAIILAAVFFAFPRILASHEADHENDN